MSLYGKILLLYKRRHYMSLIITENYYEKYHDKDGAQTIIFNTPGG